MPVGEAFGRPAGLIHFQGIYQGAGDHRSPLQYLVVGTDGNKSISGI